MDRADESLFICVTIDERRFCFNFSAAPSACFLEGKTFGFLMLQVSEFLCVVVSCYNWNTGGSLRDFAKKPLNDYRNDLTKPTGIPKPEFCLGHFRGESLIPLYSTIWEE